MIESDFKAACRRLKEQGFDIREAVYDEAVFGSWFIELSMPRRRLVWDGRDRTLAVQTKPLRGGWTNRWVGAEENDQCIDAALRQLEAT